jgi:hypothetical protein
MTSCKPISIPLEQNVKLNANEGNLWRIAQTHSGEFDLHDHHKVRFELCSWSGELMHANTTKATFGCNETHTEVLKTYFTLWNFL